ncbi:DUF7344 domain-containing protein [Halovenus marina]|uniref:DUF7344 domain-containing protein n=1 Tax=Halovenus marina TaxID=3396621 RepID=UPI003F56F6A0
MSHDSYEPTGKPPTELNDGSTAILLHPAIDRIFDQLSTRRRRLILLSLKQEDVRTETDLMIRGKSDDTTAEVELVHNHLPKLEDAGYIKWNRETGEISKGPNFDEIEPLLELIENHVDELPPDWP